MCRHARALNLSFPNRENVMSIREQLFTNYNYASRASSAYEEPKIS